MVGCGLLRPVPKKARSDTPKKFKQLCIDCCKVSRDDRPTFDFVSASRRSAPQTNTLVSAVRPENTNEKSKR